MGDAVMVSAILGKILAWMAGHPASVGLIAGAPEAVAFGFTDGERGRSKSRGRMKAGEDDARLRRGDGVAGESESEISSILVHSSWVVGCEADLA